MVAGDVEKIFGIEIKSPDNFRIALTHPSYIKDNNLPYVECYERLEFLGDAVLELVASDYLFNKFVQLLFQIILLQKLQIR